MANAHVQKMVTLTCLCFIGLFFIMGTLPISRYTVMDGAGSQPLQPSAATFGDTPYDKTQLLYDNNFYPNVDHWNFTSSPYLVNGVLNASWNNSIPGYPGIGVGQFNHSSPALGTLQPTTIQTAIYGGVSCFTELRSNDSKYLQIPGGLTRSKLNVQFSSDLSNGDIIILRFTGGNHAATINVRDWDTFLPPVYGTGSYGGSGYQEINITLNGLSAPENQFNLDVDVALIPSYYVQLNHVLAYYRTGAKTFSQNASISQIFTTPKNYSYGYNLNFSGQVLAFDNVLSANLAVKINDSVVWNNNITQVSSATQIIVNIPHGVLQSGGSFVIYFLVNLTVNTAAQVNFKSFLGNVYLYQTPNLNLLDDSECVFPTPYWTTSTTGNGFIAIHDPLTQVFQFGFNGTSSANGGTNLKQTFALNSTQQDFTLVVNYRSIAMTNIDHVNLTAYLNETQVGNRVQITQTSSEWQQARFNATGALSVKGGVYTLNISLDVLGIGTGTEIKTWYMVLDNIFLYANWGSNLTRLGSYDGNVSAGRGAEAIYQYNTLFVIPPQQAILNTTIKVYNNDSGIEWGLDVFGTRKYDVINYGNGTYKVQLSSVGFSVGLYNLSVVFIKPNFPDTSDFLQLNITGTPANVSVSWGATWNNEHQIWFVDESNTPYIGDNSKKVTLFVIDNITKQPILNAFIEAQMGPNTLIWNEIYKRTGYPSDQGYYEVIMNTTDILPQLEYLLLNFSVRVTAVNYSALTVDLTTKVNPLPTSISIPTIEPFYEGSALSLTAIFQDTFHGTGIDYANLTWVIVERPEYYGSLDFVFLGFYQTILPLETIDAGNYTLRLTGEMQNYETSNLEQMIEVTPRWNVTIFVNFPLEFTEGNSYQITYNFTYTELGGPLVGESVNFFVNYTHAHYQENYNLFTGDNGLVTITIMVPMTETLINITATYGGKTNVSSNDISNEIPVIGRYAVLLTILTNDYEGELVGETNLEIHAKLTYANGTPIEGATLLFQISTSEVSMVTDATGTAIAFVKLPTEGSFTIIVTYEGTSMIQAASKEGAALTIISPTAAFMGQLTNYAIYAGIIAAIVFGLYIGVSRGVVRPRQRARQADYVGLMNRFEDARNIQLLMLINRESGTEIYSKALSGVPVDPTLVTGFLQAIMSFGKELISEEKVEAMQGPKAYLAKTKGKAETQILEFHHFKIILEETAHLRIALLLLKNPSQRLLNALHKFSERAETRFGAAVEQLHGRQLTDDDTWELIDDSFEPSLIYVHMTDLVNARSITPTKWEMVVLDEIQRAPFYGEAYLDTLQEQIAHRYIGKELEIVDAGLSLRHKNVLLALSPRYMEVRLSIKKVIDSLPVSAKHIILTIGDGENNAPKIIQKVKVPQIEFESIVQQLQELGIITDKLQLDMAGKLVYTTLKVGAEKLKK